MPGRFRTRRTIQVVHNPPRRTFLLTTTSYNDIVTHDIVDGLKSPLRAGGKMPDSQALTTAMFHVLLALADGDKHGYAILKEVETRTNGEVQLGTGTLYGIIKRLLMNDMITEVRHSAAKNDDPRRRYYKLTDAGRETAVAEAKRLEKLVADARSKRLIKTFRTT